jgi:hypothetical protein
MAKDKQEELKQSATYEVMPSGNVGFTPLQRLFVEYYVGSYTKACEAMQKDGIDISLAEAKYISGLPSVKIALKTRDSIIETVASKKNRQAFWTKVMKDEAEDMRNRLKASELLGKSEKDFVEKVEHSLEADFAKILLDARKRHQKLSGENPEAITVEPESEYTENTPGFKSMLR